MNVCRLPSFIVILLCFSCDKPLPSLEGLDRDRWIGDKNGCEGIRLSMREAIDRQKEKLLALDQMQIVELLGRPDVNELSTRNQKFFYYFLEAAPPCGESAKETPEKLAIRFNAMGLAKEVAVVKGEW